MKATSLAVEKVIVAFAEFDTVLDIQISEWQSEAEFPKSLSYSQRFLWLKNYCYKLAEANKGRRYKFVIC